MIDAVSHENKQRIKKLNAELRLGRRRERQLLRAVENMEATLDAYLLARSRCEVLVKQLDLAEHAENREKIFALAPQIRAAITERNTLQSQYVKLTSRLAVRFGIDIRPKHQETQPA